MTALPHGGLAVGNPPLHRISNGRGFMRKTQLYRKERIEHSNQCMFRVELKKGGRVAHKLDGALVSQRVKKKNA